MKDPIIEEVRRIRKAIESENNNDWDKIKQYLEEKQAQSSKPPVSYSPKKLTDRGVA